MRAKNTTAKLERPYSFGGTPLSQAANSPATKTTKSRDTDGVVRHTNAKRAMDLSKADGKDAQVKDLRGFNQAKFMNAEAYFKKGTPRCESEPTWSKFAGKEVR